MATPIKTLQKRLLAAQGKAPCDLLIEGVTYLDVFSCTWRQGEVAIHDGFIVSIEGSRPAKRKISGKGKFLVPGFVDAHVHVESSLMTPAHFEQAVLPRGTTTAICDPHELANVQGVSGIRYFLKAAETSALNLRVMLSSCVPATQLETNGGGTLGAADILPLMRHPKSLGLAEVMNMPGVVGGDPKVLAKIVGFAGRPIDGHAPMLRGPALAAYASTGISSCHESSELAEAQEKLRNGISVWIREGSVAKDLEALAPLLSLATSTSVGFCTDDRNPLDVQTEGHVDHLIRGAIRLGVAPEVAYRAASWSPSRHYGLNQGPERLGAIAPGYAADLVLLGDAKTCAVEQVFKSGRLVGELEFARARSSLAPNSIRAHKPQERDLLAPTGQVLAIGVREGKLLTDRLTSSSQDPSLARLSVLGRYGKGRKPANAYVRGFGAGLKGAIASSVGHDSHNLIVVGRETRDMRVALGALIESGGGFCVVQDGAVQALLPLPLGGLMSLKQASEVSTELRKLKAASRAIGCELHEPFLQLAFLSLPVIPSLKLTDRGLVDVDRFEFVDVRV